MTQADLIIIGAGPGGYETAARAVADGLKVVIIERDQPGGTCLNRGCIPTKTLFQSALTADTVCRAAEFGISCSAPAVDFPAVMRRKDEVVASLRQGVTAELKGAILIEGEARFNGNVVEVNGESYSAPRIVIATGSAPARLNIPGAELALDSDALLSTSELPESIIIIGGGVIGMEFASILNALGVKVTVLEYCREIVPALDAEVAKRLRMTLRKGGIEITTSASVTSINNVEGKLSVNFTEKGKEKSAEAAMVLMATGRRAVIPEGFREAGGEVDSRGFIVTADDYATSIPGVYAIGDVNGKCMLAHAATAQGMSLLGHEMNTEVIPSVVFTMPECAMVGLTEQQSLDRGLNIVTGKSTFRANGKAVASGETDGMVKIIADADSGLILGCHICGSHAADLIQEATIAIASGMTAEGLRSVVHPHPTLSEALYAAIP
ncbi:MAG: dihydrolipoyl dehydrogenase [Lachnoclostridium sp.]|nr:dihydrolipoyl dehydrogenase [Lachnoclostridium sp.]